MEAVLEKQVGTISMEQWDNLHTIEELDSSLKAIIHRERPLIDPDWRSKPTYSWEEVYEELCKDLGKHYGLNDIREAK